MVYRVEGKPFRSQAFRMFDNKTRHEAVAMKTQSRKSIPKTQAPEPQALKRMKQGALEQVM